MYNLLTPANSLLFYYNQKHLFFRYKVSIALPCTIIKTSITQRQTLNGYRYSQLQIHSLITNEQLRSQSHPVYGDMLILEYSARQGRTVQIRRAFAYVLAVQQQKAAKYVASNTPLSKWIVIINAQMHWSWDLYLRVRDEYGKKFCYYNKQTFVD